MCIVSMNNRFRSQQERMNDDRTKVFFVMCSKKKQERSKQYCNKNWIVRVIMLRGSGRVNVHNNIIIYFFILPNSTLTTPCTTGIASRRET